MIQNQELVLLGLLKEGPKHGYEIKRLIQQVLGEFTNLETTSIYYPLAKLEKNGLVIKKKGRKGKYPEKYIYHLTKKGSQRFGVLLNRSFLRVQRPCLELDLSLFFLPSIKPSIARRRLSSRAEALKKVLKWLQMQKASLERKNASHYLKLISHHNIEALKTELKFLSDLIKNFKKTSKEVSKKAK